MFHFKSVFTLSVYQSFVSYCFISSSYPLTLGDFIQCHRAADSFIRHIVDCCLLFVCILNKLLSMPKSELCFLCVWDRSWGIIIKIITVNCLLVTHTLINALFLTCAN